MRTLTPRLTALTLAVSLLTAPIITLTAAAPAQASSAEDQKYETTNHKLTGEARKKVGLRPLIRDKEIDKVAKNWSKNMAEKHTMYHNPNFSKQIREGWHHAGENVAYTCHSTGDLGTRVHNLWMNSKGHRENILRHEFTRIGIGFHTDNKGCTWATQVFAGYVTDPNPKLPIIKKKSTITGFDTSKTAKPNKKITWKGVKVSNTAVLQRYDKKKWKTVRTLKKGTHNITLKAAKKNKAVKHYRIVVKETATTQRKTSPTVRLTAKK